MKGLRIEFAKKGSRILTDKSVSGFESTCQNALVNIGTEVSSHGFNTSKGTALFSSSVKGNLLNQQRLVHACNFAAVDTLYFSRSSETYSPNKLQKINLFPTVSADGAVIKSSFVADDGQTIGITIPL